MFYSDIKPVRRFTPLEWSTVRSEINQAFPKYYLGVCLSTVGIRSPHTVIRDIMGSTYTYSCDLAPLPLKRLLSLPPHHVYNHHQAFNIPLHGLLLKNKILRTKDLGSQYFTSHLRWFDSSFLQFEKIHQAVSTHIIYSKNTVFTKSNVLQNMFSVFNSNYIKYGK